MIDPVVLRANERIKAISGTLFSLGMALVTAIAGKLYLQPTIDLVVIVWIVGAAALLWVGWLSLSLLEAEEY